MQPCNDRATVPIRTRRTIVSVFQLRYRYPLGPQSDTICLLKQTTQSSFGKGFVIDDCSSQITHVEYPISNDNPSR